MQERPELQANCSLLLITAMHRSADTAGVQYPKISLIKHLFQPFLEVHTGCEGSK